MLTAIKEEGEGETEGSGDEGEESTASDEETVPNESE